MNATRTLLLSTLLVPVLAAATAPADSLVFKPEPGTTIQRAWKVKQEMTLDDMQMFLSGNPLGMQMEMSMSMENRIEVTDTYVALRDGAPKELRRTFDVLSTSGEMSMEAAQPPGGGMETPVEGTSELEGKTVRFTWNAEKDAFDKAFHESEGDADLLSDLEQDMDALDVLPKKAVEVGDKWELDVKKLRPLLAPGGDVRIRPDLEGGQTSQMPGMDNMGDLNAMLGEMLEGKATAEYKGIEEIDGGRYGVIALTLELSSSNDMAELVAGKLEDMPEEMGQIEIDHMDVDFTMNATGRLLWDVAGNHVGGLDLSGDVSMEIDSGMKVHIQGQSPTIEQTMKMSGTISIQLAVTKG